MSDRYTKVNVDKELLELVKVKALADGRSVTNYIERLLRADVNDMQRNDSKGTEGIANASRKAY